MKLLKWLIWLTLGFVFLVTVVGLGGFLWYRYVQSLYIQAHIAYLAGDCQSVVPLHDRVRGYPGYIGEFIVQSQVEWEECTAYLEAVDHAAVSEPAAGIETFAAFRAGYPDGVCAPYALQHIEDLYISWGASYRAGHAYEDALLVYAQMAQNYPGMAHPADAQSLLTYLDWGLYLSNSREYDSAIEVYDRMSAHGDDYAEAALTPCNKAYLAWAEQLLQSKQYKEAEQVYRVLLQREQDRLLPISLSKLDWPEIKPYPYAVVNVDWQETTAKTGPGEAYPSYESTDQSSARRYHGLVGANMDETWYAVSLGQAFSKADLGRFDDIRDLPWPAGLNPVVWVPAEDVTVVMTATDKLPLPGVLLYQLSNQSIFVDEVISGLQETYTAWAEAASQAGDLYLAKDLYVALPELTLDEHIKEEIWQKVAFVCLETAGTLNTQAAFAESTDYTLYVEDYDISGEVLPPARALRVENWMQLGRQCVEQDDWQAAGEYFNEILSFEKTLVANGETLPVWQSPAAADGLAAVHLAWGRSLHDQGQYQAALSHYQLILDDQALHSLRIETAQLAAQAWLDWGVDLKARGDLAQAIEKLLVAAVRTSDVQMIKDIDDLFADILVETEQAIDNEAGCTEVVVLDALAVTASADGALKALPKALSQCGWQALAEKNRLTLVDAEAAFSRLIAEFPRSEFVGRSERGLLFVEWKRLVKAKGIAPASTSICDTAGSNIQANRSTLEKPYTLQIAGQSFIIYNSSLIPDWKTPAGEAPSVVVCVNESPVFLQSCAYKDGYRVIRYRYKLDLRIIDPLAGKTVMTGALNGTAPEACKFMEFFTSSTKEKYGDHVSPDQVMDWLSGYLK
jgi:tetratricopeptide (TPR) repeat protein